MDSIKKDNNFSLFIGWAILCIGLITIAYIFNLPSTKIGVIILTLITILIIAPVFVILLIRQYRKELKKIENKENKDG